MISLCIPTYNRTTLLFKSFEQVLDDERVSEIVIVDDHSTNIDVLTELALFSKNKPNKVKLSLNKENLDCNKNKAEAISKASNEWVIIFDSDNVISKSYIDRIENLMIAGLNSKTIYQPSFAKPHFNFKPFEGMNITRANVGKYMRNNMFETMLNAMNYFVNRDEYMRVWDDKTDPVTSDSIYQNYRWLEAGNSIYVVPGLEYLHRVDDHGDEEKGHYSTNVRRTPKGFHNDIVRKLRLMR